MILGTQLLLFADVDPTRGYGIDRDVERGQGDGQRMGQRVDAALRSGVGLGSGLALQVAGRAEVDDCLLYTSPRPRDRTRSRMPSSA